ncbi:MAG: hypothetical protein HYZ58_06865 [Acidobacteria bacterium]|nr:hypothetical protein [Acidobacteriota bacterium]MBI3262855.1 hypothetical protein [Acidobacteriota bacterium]
MRAFSFSMRGVGHAMVRLIEHAALISIGFVLMVIGLGLGVTMIMLPVGLVVGLAGVLLFVVGLLQRFDSGP